MLGRLGRLALSLLPLVCVCAHSRAADPDVWPIYRPPQPRLHSHAQWAMPVMLVGAGFLLVKGVHLSGANFHWRDTYSHRRESWMSVDDVIQWGPIVTAVGMRVAGVRGYSASGTDFAETATVAALSMGIVVNAVKLMRISLRPDRRGWNSFMSGHTALAFMGAELLRMEYGAQYPWVAAAGYGLAISTGAMRVYHRRHWIGDVVAGAGVGLAAAWFGRLLQPHVDDMLCALRARRRRAAESAGHVALSVAPMLEQRAVGMALSLQF